MAQDQLVPFGVNFVEFVTMKDNTVATDELIDEVLANCVPADGPTKPPMSMGTVVAADDALRLYLVGARLGQKVFAQLDTIEAAIVKTSLTRGVQSRIDSCFGNH